MPTALAEAASFAGVDGTSSVTFHDDRVVWEEGAVSSHAIEYARLTMLRVAARASDVPRLVAVDTAQRRWEMALQPADVARVQATLDIVDTRLAAMAAPPPSASPVLARVLALLAVFAAAIVDHVAAVFVVMLAAILPAVPLTAAAGAALIGAAAIVLRDHWFGGIDWRPWLALACLVIGASLLAVSIVNRRTAVAPTARRLVAVLGVAALLVWTLVAFTGLSAIDLHRGTRAWPSAAVLALSFGGALAFAERRATRCAAAALAATGLLTVFAGSISFLDRFGSDPFLAASGAVAVRSIDASMTEDEFDVPFAVTGMSLSPAGRHAAFQSEDQNEDVTIHAGPIHGPLASFPADQAVFLDEGRLLLLDSRRGTSTLRVVDLDQGDREVWSRQVPFYAEHVTADRASNRWQLLGWNADRDIVSVTGTIGSDETNAESFRRHTSDGGLMRPLAIGNGQMLALELQMPSAWRSSLVLVRLATLIQQDYHGESRLWSVNREGASAFATSHFDVRCPHHTAGDTRPVCAVYDGTRTGIFSVDPSARSLTALASMTGLFFPRGSAGAGWIAGWWDHAPVLVHPASRTVLRVDADDQEPPDLLAMAMPIVSAVWSGGNQSTVRLYSIN